MDNRGGFAMEPTTARRLTTFDAMVLVGAMALALVPASVDWPLAWEVFRRVDPRRVVEYGPGVYFSGHTPTGRMDSIGLSGVHAVQAFLGLGRVWMGGPRMSRRQFLTNWGVTRTGFNGVATGYAVAGEAYTLAFPFLMAWTFALLPLRLRQPRPAPGLLWRQPGWWTSVAAVGATGAGLLEETVIGFPAYTVALPLAVLLAWLGLALSRWWTPEASWVDRAGRALGVAWLAMVPLFVLGFIFNHR
jgi:hypothetical protein